LKAVGKGLADVEARRTRPTGEFFRQFDRKHRIQD
jgi:hypothetical protein